MPTLDDGAGPDKVEDDQASAHIHSPHSDDIPDGGIIAWLQVLGSFLIYFNNWGLANSFGVYQTYYERAWPLESSSNISWIGAIQSFLLSSLSLFVGPLFDMGYYLYLEVVGAILIIVGVMMTSLCTTYWQAMLAQGVCIGIGSSCLYIPSVSIPTAYFSKKRPFASGLATLGSSVGAIVYSIVFHTLEPTHGFEQATRAIGYIALGTLVVAVALLRPRLRTKTRRSINSFGALREPAYASYTLSIFFMFMGMYIPFFYITSYGIDKMHLERHMSFYLIAILNAGSAVGRILPNFVANYVGTFNVLVPATVLTMIMAYVWIAVHTLGGIVVFALLFGMASGAYVSLQAAAVAALSRDMRVFGGRMGLVFLSGGLGALIGNPIAGVLVNRTTGSYWRTQVFSGSLVAGAALCLVACRWILVRTKWLVKV